MTNPPSPARFHTTRWSVVLDALVPERESRAALETLCHTYWFPLYTFVRRRGHTHHEAQDLVQSFFARLVEKHDWRVDPARGRFRAYLAAAMRHFLANQSERERAEKRGGGKPLLSIDALAEQRFELEALDNETPERAYERTFALSLLDEALKTLAAEQSRAKKSELFECLRPYLGLDAAPPPYARLAGELGLTEGALRVALHRLRKRFGELVRLEIADLVSHPAEVESELEALLEALSA